jgi:hypothetical protein
MSGESIGDRGRRKTEKTLSFSKSTSKFTRTFFLLVFVLSVPFWLIDPVAGQLLRDVIPIDLPVSALQAVSPLLAASILVYVEGGED